MCICCKLKPGPKFSGAGGRMSGSAPANQMLPANGRWRQLACVLALFCGVIQSPGVVLWSDLGSTLVKNSGVGEDILRGVIKRDDTAADSLYFKFHVDPLSDISTERYSAGFQLFEGETERLGLGN